jgi:hypothetical protein
LRKIFQAGIFARGVSAVGLPVTFCFMQKLADNDTAARALFERRVRCETALWAFGRCAHDVLLIKIEF